MAFTAQISVNGIPVPIINPHYPINGRMCTLEDLFVEYNQLNLLNHSYRLLAPDKDLCPSVLDIYDDNVKVYYIEEDIYQLMKAEDSSIIFYDFAKSMEVAAGSWGSVLNNITSRPSFVNPILDNGHTSTLIGSGDFELDNKDYRSIDVSEGYKQFTNIYSPNISNPKYSNYWAIYMKSLLYKTYITNMFITYFNLTEVTENDSENILFNILATKIREQQRALGKNVFLKEVSLFNNIWRDAGKIIVDFFNYVFVNMQYKNEYVFYSLNTMSSGIKALNIIKSYWQKIDPNYNPDQSKCCYQFTIGQDTFGYYVKTTSPVEITKYLCREITDLNENGDVKKYLKYICFDDITDMAILLLHYILKNFIYLPYHIPNIGVNTEGSQDLYYDNNNTLCSYKNEYDEQSWKTMEERANNNFDKITKGYYAPAGVYANYKNNVNKCLVRMCDVLPGFFVFSDDSQDYTDNGKISTAQSNTAFLHNQTDTTKLSNYALSPQNYLLLNAEYEEKYYAYLCSVDIGDNSQDSISVTPDKNVSYIIQKTYYEKGGKTLPIYNIAFVPNKNNTTGSIITYTSIITLTLSNISKTVTFLLYPVLFIVFPQLNELSSKYHYDIESFTITSPVVNARVLNISVNEYKEEELVIYGHKVYKITQVEGQNEYIDIQRKHIVRNNNDDNIDQDPEYVRIRKKDYSLVKRLNNTDNIYYLLSNMTESQDLTKELTMEISISVYENEKYNQWIKEGYYTDIAGNECDTLLPLNNYEVDKEDTCNIIINFYEIENYNLTVDSETHKLKDDTELLNNNKNSIHKYVAGRTDMEVDSQFNTMKFSTTNTVTKNVLAQFATGYTSWINSKKIKLKIIQYIDNTAIIDSLNTDLGNYQNNG